MTANKTQHKLLARLLLGAVGMFLFAVFLMPPLYDAFCEITGIGGPDNEAYRAVPAGIDESRTVRVQFVTTNNEAMPWEFTPLEYEVSVHPGQSRKVKFYAKNTTSWDMVSQAIPSLVPFSAAEYFHKTECFCFNQQSLDAGAETEFWLVFIVDPDLPSAIHTITLSYTLFDVTGRALPRPI